MHPILARLAALGLILSTAAHSAGISILEKDGRAFTGPNPPPPYARLLADNGFSLGFPPVNMRETAKLSPELVRQFNVVVVPTLLGWATDMKPDQLTSILDEYLQAGGGVLPPPPDGPTKQAAPRRDHPNTYAAASCQRNLLIIESSYWPQDGSWARPKRANGVCCCLVRQGHRRSTRRGIQFNTKRLDAQGEISSGALPPGSAIHAR